jgi:hypothetical protein
MIGKYAVSASYAILRLYSNELFPTSIRNSCMGACSMISRMGVIIAPLILALVRFKDFICHVKLGVNFNNVVLFDF